MSERSKDVQQQMDRLINATMANRTAIQVIVKGIGEMNLPVRDAILDQLRGEMEDAEKAGASSVAESLRDLLRAM